MPSAGESDQAPRTMIAARHLSGQIGVHSPLGVTRRTAPGPASTASISQTGVCAGANCSRPVNTDGVSHFRNSRSDPGGSAIVPRPFFRCSHLGSGSSVRRAVSDFVRPTARPRSATSFPHVIPEPNFAKHSPEQFEKTLCFVRAFESSSWPTEHGIICRSPNSSFYP
jgi:hypothetical protein